LEKSESPDADRSASLPPAPDFAQLVLSLYASTMMSLGFSPDKDAAAGPRDLPTAKQTIDILEMLAEKTKGNLTADEEVLLKESLTTLRLIFVKEWEKR